MEFRSMAELNLANWFDQKGIKYEYEKRKYSYTSNIKNGVCPKCGIPAVQNRVYTLDFWLPDYSFGLEVKGQLVSEERKKYRDVKRSNPDLDLRFLFLANNKLDKRSPERYTDWAAKYHFPASVRAVNPEWLTNAVHTQ